MYSFSALLLIILIGASTTCGFKPVLVPKIKTLTPSANLFRCQSLPALQARAGSDRAFVGEVTQNRTVRTIFRSFTTKIVEFCRIFFARIFKIPQRTFSIAKSYVLKAAVLDEITSNKKAAAKILAGISNSLSSTVATSTELEESIFLEKTFKANAAADLSLENQRQEAISAANAFKLAHLSPKDRELAEFNAKLAVANASAEASLQKERAAAVALAVARKAAAETSVIRGSVIL
jgi:hypothetical protein